MNKHDVLEKRLTAVREDPDNDDPLRPLPSLISGGDAGLALARAPELGGPRHLCLAGNPVGPAGRRALRESSRLRCHIEVDEDST